MGGTLITSTGGEVQITSIRRLEPGSFFRLSVWLKKTLARREGFSAASFSGRYLYITIPPQAVG